MYVNSTQLQHASLDTAVQVELIMMMVIAMKMTSLHEAVVILIIMRMRIMMTATYASLNRT